MINNNKYPILRFKDNKDNFSDWKKFAFVEFAEKKTKTINPINISKNCPIIELENIESDSGRIINISSYKEQKSLKTQFSKGDILFGKLRPYLKKFAYMDYSGVCSSEIWVFKSKLENKKLLYYIIQTNLFNKVANISSGSKMPRSDWSIVSSTKFYLPTDKNEQQKIAAFLTAVDDKINALKRKHELLTEYKRGVMQKIFSQEIRFTDENGEAYPDWEPTQLKSVLKERKEYSVKRKGLPHISLTKEGVVPKTERFNRDFLVSNGETKKYKITYLGDLCYNPANLKFGVISLNTYGNGIFSPIYVTFEVLNVNKEFLMSLIYQPLFINQVRRFEQGTVYERQAVNPNDFVKAFVNLPSFSEQEKIAEFVMLIDKKVNLIGLKIEKMETFKKGLLQQMFV